MEENKNNKVVEQPTEQENKSINNEKEVKDKKNHKGLKVAAGIGGALVVGGIAMNVMLPNVKNAMIDKAEEIVYNATKIKFDFNENGKIPDNDFEPEKEEYISYYGSVSVESFEE